MKTERKSISSLILQIALGLLFLVSGIWSLQSGNGDEIAGAIRSIFDGDIEKVLVVVFAIIEIITGVFLLLRIFLNGVIFNVIILIASILISVTQVSKKYSISPRKMSTEKQHPLAECSAGGYAFYIFCSESHVRKLFAIANCPGVIPCTNCATL